MSNPLEHGYYSGLRLHVSPDGKLSWQPSRYAGNHGARYEVTDTSGLAKSVLEKRPSGGGIRITSRGEVLFWNKNKPESMFQLDEIPKLQMPPFDLEPKDLTPGMIWSGPYDGERHHFFNGRAWSRTSDRKRCYWKGIPESLLSVLERFKPEGGHFLITPWRQVIALIVPKPLPKEARDQWASMTKEEQRLLQLKKQSTSMLPIFLGMLDEGFEVTVDPPVDYSTPLTASELNEMEDFLSQFDLNPSSRTSDKSPKMDDQDTEAEESTESFQDSDFDDDYDEVSSFFDEDLNSLYAPEAVE